MRRLTALLALAAVFAGGPGADLAAAVNCPQTSLAEIEHEVMCPVCRVPLALATEAPQAQRERAFIQQEVAACKSKQQIKDELVAQYGDRVLALPPDRGFNIAAYVAPFAAVLAGLAVVGTLGVRLRRRRGTAAATPTGPSLSGDDAARLDADLKRYDL
jgi:cytochrome c-type biogenesis protein CcmH/NrfF